MRYDRGAGGAAGAAGPEGPASDLLSVLTSTPVSVTTTAALTGTAFGKLHVCTGTSANYTVTLPDPTSNAGKLIGFRMSPALTKLVTLAQHASETIDGTATRIMWGAETAILLTDGTNWFKIAGKSIPMTCSLKRGSSSSAISTGAWTVVPMDAQVSGTSLLYDSGAGQIVIVRPGNYLGASSAYVGTTSGDTKIFVSIKINSTDATYSSSPAYWPAAATAAAAGFLAPSMTLAVGDTINCEAYVQVATGPLVVDNAIPATVAVTEIPAW